MSESEESGALEPTKKRNKEFPEEVLFTIFKIMTFEEVFSASEVSNQWNKSVNKYLENKFLDKKSLGICLPMDQLPDIHRQCLNASKSDIRRRQSCGDISHRSDDDIYLGHSPNINRVMSLMSLILEESPSLQSLDVRSLVLDLSFMRKVNECCPRLECLYLDSVKIDSKAFHYLHKKIFPKLLHLSIDNLFEVTDWDKTESVWDLLFRYGNNLQELKLDIFPVESQFNSSSLSQISDEMDLIHINHYSKSDKPNAIRLKNLIKNLTQGLGRNIRFLRLYSEEENDDDHDHFNEELNKFTQLKAFNLNLKLFNHFNWIYQTLSEVSELKSLSLNLNNLPESQQILSLYLRSDVKESTNRLKLENVVISDEILDLLNTYYKNLVSLQLIDVFFENYNSFIDWLAINNELDYLLLQFSRHNNNERPEYSDFPGDKFIDFISKTNQLKELELINCKQIDRNKCQQLCKIKKIELLFK